MRILITGGKSAVALKLLKAFTTSEVFLADYDEVPNFSSANYLFMSLGKKNEDTLAHLFLNQCLDHQIDAILPLHYDEIESLAKAGILFKEFNVNLIVPDLENYQSYLTKEIDNKADWAIFINGEIVFSTQELTTLTTIAKAQKLSGAFYFETLDGDVKLSLIHI